ncbi:MAG: N-acetylneuraminate synthase family protein [Elusimicrobiota bacterium]|jgi:N,N'-diacetyllegionaminate synthase
MTKTVQEKTFNWKPWTLEAPGSVLLIAEIANAHEGRAADAEHMIEAAADAGCGAVKFQKYYAEEMLAPGHPMQATFKAWEWDAKTWAKLITCARERGLGVFVDVFGVRAYRSLAELPPVDGIKIHGADIANVPLLAELSKTSCPILIGTGGSSDVDIHHALSKLEKLERVVLMHGFQAFPTPLEETGLARIPHLSRTFGTAVGLSDHLDAEHSFARLLPLMAVPLGACCVEKHITLNRSAKGIDYQSALEPKELSSLAKDLRSAETARGETGLAPSALQEKYRRRFKKSLSAAGDIPAGRTITAEDLVFHMNMEPERYSLPYGQALGSRSAQKIPAGTLLSGKHVGSKAGLCLVVRLKSQRLPRKALADIHGMTSIERLITRAKLCTAAERPVLCTSTDPQDAPLLEVAAKAGIDSYAGDPDQPLERLIACAEKFGWKYAIRATGDNIFLDPDLLQQAVDLALDKNLDYVSMFNAPTGTHCEIMSLSALKIIQDYADAAFTTEYLTWYLLDEANFHSADLPIPEPLRKSWRLTLDTPQDLENIRDTVALLGPENHGYTLKELVAAVSAKPELEARLRMTPGLVKAPSRVQYRFAARDKGTARKGTH